MTVKPRGPKASAMLNAMRNRDIGWARSLAELIDNSIGNGATIVNVRLSPTCVSVVDNGVGCTPNKFAALVSIGWHEEDDAVENMVSRYGIGAKDAFLYFDGITKVASVRDGQGIHTVVDWSSFEDEWNYEEPIQGAQATRAARKMGVKESGVAIEMPSHKRQINAKSFESIRKALSRMFWAAVETGVTIKVVYLPNTGKPQGGGLAGKPMPGFIDGHTINEQCELEDGRTIQINGGVLAPSVRISSPGFEFIYGHRVVIEAGGVGAGGLDFERFYARVLLLGDKGDWQVTTNKTGLHDSDEAMVAQLVYDKCRDLLTAASSQPIANLVEDELLREISDDLASAHKRRQRRSPGESSGTVTPKNTERKQRFAEDVHECDGNHEPKRRGRRPQQPRIVRAEFADDEAHLCGKANVRDKIIRVNCLHPFVAECLETRDKSALRMRAYALWSAAWCSTDDRGQTLMIERGKFDGKLSAMVAAEQRDGKALAVGS